MPCPLPPVSPTPSASCEQLPSFVRLRSEGSQMDLPAPSQELESDSQWQQTWRPLPMGDSVPQAQIPHKPGRRPPHTHALGGTHPALLFSFSSRPSGRFIFSKSPNDLTISCGCGWVKFFFSNFLLLFPADLTFHAQGQITCQRLPTLQMQRQPLVQAGP